MATNKKAKLLAETIELEGELQNFVSYATYYCRMPLFTAFRIYNRGAAPAENLTVAITGSNALILAQTVGISQIPAESSVQVAVEKVLNPKYLAELDQTEVCTVRIVISCGKDTVCDLSADVNCLPIDYWEGLGGNAEMLSGFVRPKIADCQKILAEAGLQLKTWGYSSEWSGYSGNDRNAVRSAAAAIFSAIRRQNVESEAGGALSEPVSAGNITKIISSKSATPLQMALFFASCAEASKLHPVIVLGKDSVAAGVWLYESCFTSPTQDDMLVVEKYVQDGVNNLSLFDVNDLFSHKNASYTTSEAHFLSLLRRDNYELCLDVKRCRIDGVYPLPIKVKEGGKYELLGEREFSYEEKPNQLIDAGKYALEKGASKEKTWQRRLLDLSLKNNLLNFRYRSDCLHIISADLAEFTSRADVSEKFNVQTGSSAEPSAFGAAAASRGLQELINIEMSSGIIRTYASNEKLSEAAASLIRKARAAEEEAGANTLCLALGFLKWKHSGEKEDKFAPIALIPVQLKRSKQQGVVLAADGDITVNTTLLEFLKQEFGIDIRGIEDGNLSVTEMCALFRAKAADMKGWQVYEDVYLAQFTFARYAMWADVKANIQTYRNNPLIASLIANTNKIENNKLRGAAEDVADPSDILVPLPCDSSQFEAVAESDKGTTFVLHGPPGTGKSQTITNMIANALSKGRRVLFVAEKQAALSVVKKRLDDIGIGEFCMEFSSGKSADKAGIVRSIEQTLALKDQFTEGRFNDAAGEIEQTRSSLLKPYNALHKKRRLGVSVYEGILYYLQNRNAPELVNIESTFYDSLTKEKLASYEDMLVKAQVAAKECGGVYRSPFENVNLSHCDENVKNSVLCSAEVVLAELKHLKNYLGLFLETFNQKISSFNEKKLRGLISVASAILSGELNVFFDCDEEQFYNFYNANVIYDKTVKVWLTRFDTLPDLDKFLGEIEAELDNWGNNYRSSRLLLAVIKRLNRCTRTRLQEKEELEWIKRAYELCLAERRILSYTNLSQNFTGLGGINDRRRETFLKPLYDMHTLCSQIFMDYNADAFNSVCIHIRKGYAQPLISGVISAAKSFLSAKDYFNKVTGADKNFALDEDIFDYYTAKCTALIDNIDMLPSWCDYKHIAKELNAKGLTFITDAMESGKISGEQILSSFRKNVYRNFVQTNIPADEELSKFSASLLDESAAKFARLTEEFALLTRQKVRHDLISRLPSQETEGPLALELMTFRRRTAGNVKGLNIRSLFAEIPELLRVVSPCVLMSPFTVSQYLAPDPDLFDLVIFDEASQMPTCEAVPSLARAKSAVIVGDPKQLSPTTFFMTLGQQDEEELEAEDLDSVLDDCLTLGIPEKHLNWHYRSKHESLIAFSNIMYYSSKLCTFPSPDALDSKVKLVYIQDGVYDRGATKCNRQEADALVAEVIRRLKDSKLSRSSIGVVTFSTPQQNYIERRLAKAISENGLEEAAYERDEPLFVKNLESVQGDERDVIMFSVCYGPDKAGKISLNFGPLNQYGGWRRLNVAVSRAREEMLIYSSMRYSMIDLSRTNSRGVAGLKAFLEFAEKGRTSIAANSDEVIINRSGIGKYVARELSAYGYDCRCDVGVSDFKIDVAVVDPKNKHNFILAVLCDGENKFSVKDRTVMQIQTLKRNNWNVVRLYSINFFNNPKREIKKIKEYLDKLCSGGKVTTISFKRPYRAAKLETTPQDAGWILGGDNDGEITRTIKAIVSAEEPISEQFLIKRTLAAYGIYKHGIKLDNKITALIAGCKYPCSEIMGVKYYFRADRYSSYERYRVEDGAPLRQSETDYTPYDIISLIKGLLLNKVSMYSDELVVAVQREFNVARLSDRFAAYINSCIDYGARQGIFVRSISDKISLT
ncbi:MAG: DUF4011 domain-containing protein [Clostridia bacterium]|nr:DUF4011 domain-containing protein [Clostridia bacterium]